MTTPGAKARLLSQLAAETGAASVAESAWKAAISRRNKTALAAHELPEPATYRELGEATGLTKVGVYKMLEKANGGSLRDAEQKPPTIA